MNASPPESPCRTPPTNTGLLTLIRAKRERCWKPSIAELRRGFRGWHQRGYLPHFDAPGVTQMVTFMLTDSFPVSRRAEWECWLRRREVAEVVERVLLEGHAREFRMRAWVIMPNHVHLVADVWNVPLVQLVNGWKGKSSRLANLLLQRRGAFWQLDYFDTLIQDHEHLAKAIRYTEQNPNKAALVKAPREWPWSSAHRRDGYGRLLWPGDQDR